MRLGLADDYVLAAAAAGGGGGAAAVVPHSHEICLVSLYHSMIDAIMMIH